MTKTNKKTPAPKNYLVVIVEPNGMGEIKPEHGCFLGELDGNRCGVRRRANAVRFTEKGAARVAAGYRHAFTMHEDGEDPTSLVFEIA